MNNFNDLKPGDFIWFSKEGNIGQYRVKEVDKENNKLVYADIDGINNIKEIPFNYNAVRNNEFFSDPGAAFSDAVQYANNNFKIIGAGTPNARVVYKNSFKKSIDNGKQMVFD